MLFNTKWLSSIFKNYQGKVDQSTYIEEINTDSRKIMNHALFIPIVGENFDGHDYIAQAIQNGAIALLCNKDTELPSSLPTEIIVFWVEDTLSALQTLAKRYRKEINPIVIGITGSNGKTTTKDLVTSVVKTTYNVHSTQGNFNNHIGLPLTILAMPRDTEVLVLEMGMSDFGEIEELSMIAKPDYGIITNIGESHIEYLGSRKGIAEAKLEILRGMDDEGFLIIDGDERLLSEVNSQKNLIKCGFKGSNNVMINYVEILTNETQFTLNDNECYGVPLLGKHHAQNATYAIILAKKLNITHANIKKGLEALKLTGMRFEILSGVNNVSIINDAYNASPTSMKAAIEVVKHMQGFHEKVLVLGDIFELGEHSEQLHQTVSEVIEAPIAVLFTCGDAAHFISDCVKQKTPTIVCEHFNSKDQLIHNLKPYLKEGNLLLFKASRGMHFEAIIEELQI